MIAPANMLNIDLGQIEEAAGTLAFKRGVTYARQNRVASTEWDEETHELSGRVIGDSDVYETMASFELQDGAFDFIDGECSCPVVWDCKHVVALVVTAVGVTNVSRRGAKAAVAGNGSDSQPTAADATATTLAVSSQRTPAPARSPTPAPSPWEQPLRLMLAGTHASTQGAPLAIELSVTVSASGSGAAAPRLHARLMRPGARGGWINGSLRWSALDGWDVRDLSLREDHLKLARDFHRVHQAQMASSYRYLYGSNDRDRKLDLSDWEAPQLWGLLDRAARIGLVCVHAHTPTAEVGGYRRGEISLDVRAGGAGSGGSVRPRIGVERPGSLEGFSLLMFLGSDGHGLVLTDRPADPARGRLSLVRLARETPAQLQSLVLDGRSLEIPEHDLARFSTELAPALRHVAPVTSEDGSFTVPEVSAPDLLLKVIYGPGHEARLSWRWRYQVGDETLEFGLDEVEPGVRDLEAESALLAHVDLDGTGLDQLGALDPGGAPRRGPVTVDGFRTVALTEEVLPALAGIADLLVEVTGKPPDYRDVDDQVQISVSTRTIDGQADWFDLDVMICVAGHVLAFSPVFSALARGESRMLLDDGAHFSLQGPELESLRTLIEEARALGDGGRPGRLRISRWQAGLWRDLVGLGVVREQAEGWQRQVGALTHLEELPERTAPAGLTAELRPYQLEGFNWLATLWDLGLGGILADDMGLGKTLQVLAMICHAQAGGETAPFLVIAPTSVVSNWLTEAERFAPNLAVMGVTDTLARARLDIASVAASAHVVVTTYTLARLDAEAYGAVSWAGVILDEAQAVKNHHSKTHAAVRRMPAKVKLAITGTPMENHLGELWALLSITAPGLFPDPDGFDQHYRRPVERDADEPRLAELRRRIRPLVKRRTKELVARDLPAKQEQLLEVGLHPRHRKIYDRQLQRERQRILGLLDDFDSNRFSILTGITRLRQLSLHPGLVDPDDLKIPATKLDALSEQLQDVIDGGHRALVFSQFTGFLDLVRQRLDAQGISCCYLDGKTRQREKVLSRFRDGDAPVFLISLKAGGAGLNLVEADYCFLLDPWWNPAVENQAIDRIHRIGQTRQVMVYRLVAKNTIEEKVIALAQRKAALFTGVLDEGQLFSGQISAEDIRGLLS